MAMKPNSRNAKDQRARLVEALRSKPNAQACQTCQSQLDKYVAAQLAGEDYVARFPKVAMHLDACLDCAGAYARLYELELAEATSRLLMPDHLPDPDLSFLLPEAVGPLSPATFRATALPERLRTAVHRLGDRITLQLSADLLPLLRPSPAMTPTRTPARAERYAETLLILEPDEALQSNLPLTLTAYRDAHQPEECLVETIINPPGRSWPDLAGVVVTLIVASERREATTDAWGLASFTGIPIASLADLAVEFTL